MSCRDQVAGGGVGVVLNCCWRKRTLWEQTGSGGGKGAAERHLREVARLGTPEVFSEIKPGLQKAGGVAITQISSLKKKKKQKQLLCAISPPTMYSRQLQECWQNQASVGEKLYSTCFC